MHLKGKEVPYVDVPPRKVVMRSEPVKENVREDQIAKPGPAYKNQAPVEVGIDVEKLVASILEVEVGVPLRNLAGVSNAIQKEIRRQMTKARLPVEGAQVNLVAEAIEDEENELEAVVDKSESSRPCIPVDSLPFSSYMINTEVSEDMPEGYIVGPDPVLQYLLENKDADARDLVVAKPSEALRSTYMTVNRMGEEECVIDNGSQIVSMAKDTAIQFGLTWDPSLRVNMESASNHVEGTLGLARNVRFSVGGLDLFLQVHILENPPYKILLGRPLDALTKSVVKTNEDGSSEVVLTCPNTKKVATVPTYERGKGPGMVQRQIYQGF